MEGMTERVDRVIGQMHDALGVIVEQAGQAAVLPERVEGISQQAQTAFDALASCAKQLQEITGRYEAVIAALETASQRLGEANPEGLPERVAQAVAGTDAIRLPLASIDDAVARAIDDIKALGTQAQAAEAAMRDRMQTLDDAIATLDNSVAAGAKELLEVIEAQSEQLTHALRTTLRTIVMTGLFVAAVVVATAWLL